MAYSLTLKTKTFGGDVNILDSQHVRYVRGGVTIDAATVTADGEGKKVLPIGSFLGKIAASGKYGPYKSDATDGRQTAVCILAETVDVTEGDVVATAIDHGRVITARLPVAPDATIKSQLKDITFA